MSFYRIQWAFLLRLMGVSVSFNIMGYQSLLNTHLSWLPWHLTFLVHPCIGVLFYWHIIFWYPLHATISHSYSVLEPLLFSLQTLISAVMLHDIINIHYVCISESQIFVTSQWKNLSNVLVDYLKCSHGYPIVMINSDFQNFHLFFSLILIPLHLSSIDKLLDFFKSLG